MSESSSATGRVQIGASIVEVDLESTRAAYESFGDGGPETCGCLYCRNLILARPLVYSQEVVSLLESLGIDPTKEAETWENGRLPSGLHLYGGLFHFVGQLIVGGDRMVPIAPDAWSHQVDYTDIAVHFAVGISTHPSLVNEAFKGRPVLELCFTAQVPWVIPEAEPSES